MLRLYSSKLAEMIFGSLVILMVAVLSSGCGTFLSRNRDTLEKDGNPHPKLIYSGVRYDLDVFDNESRKAFLILDIPFSFALDTLLLPITLFNRFNSGSLQRAASMGDLENVRKLLDEGESVNKKVTDFGHTPLMLAAWAGHTPIVEELIKRGADLDAKHSTSNATALFYASKQGHVEVVRSLLLGDANPLIGVDNERTPLKAAEDVEVIKLLKDAEEEIKRKREIRVPE